MFSKAWGVCHWGSTQSFPQAPQSWNCDNVPVLLFFSMQLLIHCLPLAINLNSHSVITSNPQMAPVSKFGGQFTETLHLLYYKPLTTRLNSYFWAAKGYLCYR